MEQFLDDIDLFADTAAGDVRDPYPEYAQGRREHPVQLTEEFGTPTYNLFRYDDCLRVLKDPEGFSSGVYRNTMGLVFGPSILQMDGAEHRLHRALVASAFRRQALLAWEEDLIRPTVDALLDEIALRGRSEMVREFTLRYPIRIISAMLGIPSDDYGWFARLSIEMISIAQNIERGLKASETLREYFANVIEERRKAPRDDIISTLATAEIEGHTLPDDEIHGFLRLLLPAGVETTTRLLGTLLFALLSDPDQLEALRADRSLMPAAIEEALRWEAPVQRVAREVMRDTEFAGVAVPKGASVSPILGSGNRDETKFDDPDRFDLRRRGPQHLGHLAFGEGPHRCLGEHLAGVETTVAMNRILDRLHDIRLEPGDMDPHVHGYAFRSPNCLPVAFRAE